MRAIKTLNYFLKRGEEMQVSKQAYYELEMNFCAYKKNLATFVMLMQPMIWVTRPKKLQSSLQ